MNERVTREERLQSLGEEIANSVSAGAGLIAAIAGIPLLLAFATQRGSNWTVAGALVFSATTVWLYLASTVYHALPRNRAKRLFRLFDHMAIFLLIAGTYTPFTLGALRGAVDWTLFAAVWSLAILGIGFFVFGGLSFHRLSVCACTSGAPVIWQSHFSFRENCAPPLASIEGRGCAASQDGGGPSSRIIVEDTQF